MTDLELTKKCAEAMGYEVLGFEGNSIHHYWRLGPGFMTDYDPLNNDAQAMALVKRFNLNMSSCAGQPWSVWPNALAETVHADLNRAIVECVANIKEQVPA